MAEQVTVNQTNLDENLGEYLGNSGPYNGINFKVEGDFMQADWYDVHYITKINLKLTNLNGNHRLNMFESNFCNATDTLEIHVATGDVDIMPNEDYLDTFSAASFTQVSLEPNTNEKIKVKFIVYAYDPTNKPGDLYFRKCDGRKAKIPAYKEPQQFSANKYRWDIDPQPDKKDGNIIIGA